MARIINTVNMLTGPTYNMTSYYFFSYLRNILATAIFISCIAKCCPMQFLYKRKYNKLITVIIFAC